MQRLSSKGSNDPTRAVQFPVSIELHHSVFLLFLLILFHVLAAGCVVAVPWSWLLRSALLVLVGFSLWNALRPSRILGLRLCGRDTLEGILLGGYRETLSVLPSSTVFGRLIVLRLRIGEEQRASNLALLPDQMTREQFRVLRLWLRWHAETK